MGDEPADGARLILKFKVQLIEALSADPDLVLQTCHSALILTQREYDHVNGTAVRAEQARDILDYIMRKESDSVEKFLNLLKSEGLQQTFPKLAFLKALPVRPLRTADEKGGKRNDEPPEEEVAPKRLCKASSRMVTEKQLMLVARCIGRNWMEVGRVALDMPTIKLEQIEEENPHNLRERVFNMLRHWRMREKEKALVTRLHSLLTQEENAVEPGSIDFLLEEN